MPLFCFGVFFLLLIDSFHCSFFIDNAQCCYNIVVGLLLSCITALTFVYSFLSSQGLRGRVRLQTHYYKWPYNNLTVLYIQKGTACCVSIIKGIRHLELCTHATADACEPQQRVCHSVFQCWISWSSVPHPPITGSDGSKGPLKQEGQKNLKT